MGLDRPEAVKNYLRDHMATLIWVNFGSSNDLLLTSPSHYLNKFYFSLVSFIAYRIKWLFSLLISFGSMNHYHTCRQICDKSCIVLHHGIKKLCCYMIQTCLRRLESCSAAHPLVISGRSYHVTRLSNFIIQFIHNGASYARILSQIRLRS